MLFASALTDLLPWLLVIGYLGNMVLTRMFGVEWPKQLGDYLRAWWARRTNDKEESAAQA